MSGGTSPSVLIKPLIPTVKWKLPHNTLSTASVVVRHRAYWSSHRYQRAAAVVPTPSLPPSRRATVVATRHRRCNAPPWLTNTLPLPPLTVVRAYVATRRPLFAAATQKTLFLVTTVRDSRHRRRRPLHTVTTDQHIINYSAILVQAFGQSIVVSIHHAWA